MQKETTAYTLARLPIAVSFIGHGIVRIPKINQFSEGMVQGFSETVLPLYIVEPFSIVLPFIEFLLGLTLLLGLRIKLISMAGTILICILIFGSSLQGNWSAVGTQMFYGLYLTGLFLFADYNNSFLEKINRPLSNIKGL
ncbi:DoxX family membrane protein [Euzebyella marina]|uniref:DoxX family membrane protein n=1 Tax=Euzebyella marina TaxID=1761453 RepID=A0A3G2L277_9FLAO|nr:DoxX family membrane protein [Euzebyella marina]AYN66360.1 DoxX family membrane protein [Euzebyella marina]